jgi:hypothetical protein
MSGVKGQTTKGESFSAFNIVPLAEICVVRMGEFDPKMLSIFIQLGRYSIQRQSKTEPIAHTDGMIFGQRQFRQSNGQMAENH